MSLPTFLIFGTRKAGTTSLYHYLDEHPGVFMSALKGTRYFLVDPDNPETTAHLPVQTIEQYKSYFEGAKAGVAVGEASPSYLANMRAPERIRALIPDTRLIASLRNPVDRMYSQYLMDMRLRPSEQRVSLTKNNLDDWFESGLYGKYMRNYYSHFDSSQILVLIFENWIKNREAMLHQLYSFIDVDPSFLPNLEKVYNKGGVPKNESVANLLKHRAFHIKLKPFVPDVVRSAINKVRNRNMEKAPAMDPVLREYAAERYGEDIELLESVTGLDFSVWKC